MSSLNILVNEVAAWLNRGDLTALIPGWVSMVETDIAESLRARCMVARATQAIDAAFISLPSDFITMESMRDAKTGTLLTLEDEFTGPPQGGANQGFHGPGFMPGAGFRPFPTTGYRLVANCVEFLPHPLIPDPPDPSWVPQCVNMNWYQRPKPLINPQDTNPILDTLHAIYLFGVCKYGAMFELDDARAQQMDSAFGQAVTAANLWKQTSDYSGAPLRAVVRSF